MGETRRVVPPLDDERAFHVGALENPEEIVEIGVGAVSRLPGESLGGGVRLVDVDVARDAPDLRVRRMAGLGRRLRIHLPVRRDRPVADEVGRDRDVAARTGELDRARERAHGRDRDRRMGFLIGLGHMPEPDILVDPVLEGDLPVFALDVVRGVLLPELEHDVDGLDHHGVAVRLHDAEHLEIRRQAAGAHAHDVAPLRQMVEHRDLARRDRRVVLRQADHAGAADDPLGARQHVGEEEQRRGDLLGGRGIMFAHPGLREAEPVGVDDRVDVLHQGLVVVPPGVVDRHHEQAQLHRSPPCRPTVARWATDAPPGTGRSGGIVHQRAPRRYAGERRGRP